MACTNITVTTVDIEHQISMIGLSALNTYTFMRYDDGDVALICDPVQPAVSEGDVCLLWTGAHYDVLSSMAPATLAEARMLA